MNHMVNDDAEWSAPVELADIQHSAWSLFVVGGKIIVHAELTNHRVLQPHRTRSSWSYLHEIQHRPDEQLESIHDYIQWLFPLPERSGFNVAAQSSSMLCPRSKHGVITTVSRFSLDGNRAALRQRSKTILSPIHRIHAREWL